MREDAVYKRLGSHSLSLNYDGKVLVHGAVYSLKIERALGRFRKFVLNCPARMKETSLAMAVQSVVSISYIHPKERNLRRLQYPDLILGHNVEILITYLPILTG